MGVKAAISQSHKTLNPAPHVFECRARDDVTHGSHVLSTAGGNHGVPTALSELKLSGIAPRARLAIYKVSADT